MNDFVHKYAQLIYASSVLGALVALFAVLRLARVVFTLFVLPGVDIKRRYGQEDAYALVTGATDGIGKQFSRQLAKRGLNILLVSRTQSKLDDTAKELKTEFGVTVKTLAIDFTRATQKDWDALTKLSKQLKVTMLVNNVAMSHNIPTEFVTEEQSVIDNMLRVNCEGTLRVTKIVLADMVKRNEAGECKNAIVLNIGSFAGLVPSALLQTYSASKAFLRTFSVALAKEVKQYGIHVEHLNTYFVVSNMSKVSRPSFMIPTAQQYVKSALAKVGHSYDTTPYIPHAVLAIIMKQFIPEDRLVTHTWKMQKSIRVRALKKAERLAKKE